MKYVIRIQSYGDPNVLEPHPVELGEPGPHQVLLRQTAIGVNFIDIYERTGLYSTPLPAVLGREAAGVVVAAGKSVRDLRPDDRVAYVCDRGGAYATERLIESDRLIKIPDGVSDVQAAAALLKGLTAQFLLRRLYRMKRDEKILIHAAAGGVGLLLVQWAKYLRATVIAVVGTPEKAALATRHGADHIVLAHEDLPSAVKTFTNGTGVSVVYDSVGKDTFAASLDCLRTRGTMVSFGNASGPAPPIAPLELARRGSLFLTRPSLFHYIGRRAELRKAAAELFDLIVRSKLEVQVGQQYALQNAAQAHRDLEARRTVGSTVLMP